MKITVVGIGYVGASLALLLGKNHEVIAFDIDQSKLEKLNSNKSPVNEKFMEDFMQKEDLNILATHNQKKAYLDSEYIIICTPTNYNDKNGHFDTSSIEKTIQDILKINNKATIVIKSTIPIGYVKKLKKEFLIDNLFFSPEFLREGFSLYDNLYPSRIVIGSRSSEAIKFGKILAKASQKKDVPILYMNSKEAESVKLFANSYLAMRVAYFNELDTFAKINGLMTRNIIEAIELDKRIGSDYNNPSFGYGGYCLPKDTKQLLNNFTDIPQNIIKAIVDSNDSRMDFIASDILKQNPKKVGFFRLIMKTDSDNFRTSSTLGIMTRLQNTNIIIKIYEPEVQEDHFNGFEVIKDFDKFANDVDIIIANRKEEILEPFYSKIYSRDIYGKH